MRNRLSATPLLIACLTLAAAGCAGFGSTGDAVSGGSERAHEPMDQSRLEQIFSDQVEAIVGPAGALQSQVDGIPIYCISDPVNDRMRLIAPISRLDALDRRVYEILLRANFHSALDARYAISNEFVFAAFLHPISSLTPRMIESAVSQTLSLVKTFGTTFSSGELVFPRPTSEEGSQESVDDGSSPRL